MTSLTRRDSPAGRGRSVIVPATAAQSEYPLCERQRICGGTDQRKDPAVSDAGTAPKFCTRCGTSLAGVAFCTNCGTRVENAAPAAPTEASPEGSDVTAEYAAADFSRSGEGGADLPDAEHDTDSEAIDETIANPRLVAADAPGHDTTMPLRGGEGEPSPEPPAQVTEDSGGEPADDPAPGCRGPRPRTRLRGGDRRSSSRVGVSSLPRATRAGVSSSNRSRAGVHRSSRCSSSPLSSRPGASSRDLAAAGVSSRLRSSTPGVPRRHRTSTV